MILLVVFTVENFLIHPKKSAQPAEHNEKNKMIDPLIHINRKYKIPLSKILKVRERSWGSVWVYFTDAKGQTKIAKEKCDGRSMIHLLNQYQTIFGKKLFILEKD